MYAIVRRISVTNELHVMIGPIVRAAGRRLFDGEPGISLRLAGTPRTWEGSGNVLVRYEVGRRAA